MWGRKRFGTIEQIALALGDKKEQIKGDRDGFFIAN